MSDFIKKKEKKKTGMGLKGAGDVKRPKINFSIKEVDDPNTILLDEDTLEKIKKGEKVFKKGGRVGLKAGSKGCKLAKRGRGRAYGKNS